MKVLVAYYSRSGNTRRIGNEISRTLGADVDELIDLRDRSGLLNYLLAAFDGLIHRATRLKPPRLDPARYDLVIVGTPVWGASVTPAVAAYLTTRRALFGKVAFFVTYGGSGARRVFEQMESLTGRAPLATLTVREDELGTPEASARVSRFVADLQRDEHHPPGDGRAALASGHDRDA